jgi:predicted alpha/beta-hydrolase family hydrolase
MTESSEPLATRTDGPADATAVLILAHGAGAAMDTPFMDAFAQGVAEAGIRCVRLEFPYMAARRSGGRRPPDREPVLRTTWHQAITQVSETLTPRQQLFIGGKSMGGRIASLIAAEQQAARPIAGLVCLGYPFHPPGKPQATRIAHLEDIATPTLIVQGERDPFGSRAEVAEYRLSPQVRLHWLTDGEHSFKPRKKSGATEEGNLREGVAAVVAFCQSLLRR